jgi:hypothetical protein
MMALAMDLAARALGAHGLAAQGFLAEHGFFAAQGFLAAPGPVNTKTELTTRTTTNPPPASNISGRTIFLNMGFFLLKCDPPCLGVPLDQKSQHTLTEPNGKSGWL